MWIRYNPALKYYEKSDNNGASWAQLPMSASSITEGTFPPGVIPAPIPPTRPNLPGEIAYEDEVNTFNQPQNFLGAVGTDYSGAPIEIVTTSVPRVAFHWPGVVAAQIGMNSAGTIRTYDYSGTGYCPFAASVIASTGNISCGGNFHNTGGYIYPGRTDMSGAEQGNWFLASHGSYGLSTNTGFYVEGAVWTYLVEARTHVRAATDVYAGGSFLEKGRGYALGHWNNTHPISLYAATGAWTGTVAYSGYTMIGHTVIFNFAVENSTLSAATQNIYLNLPFYNSGGYHHMCYARVYIPGIGTTGCNAYAPVGGYLLYIERDAPAVFPAGGGYHVYGQLIFRIA